MSEPLTIDTFLERLRYNLTPYTEEQRKIIRAIVWRVGPETLVAVSELDDRFPNEPEVGLRHLEPHGEYVHACMGWVKDERGHYRHVTSASFVEMDAPDNPRLLACIEWWTIRTHGGELHQATYPHSEHFRGSKQQ